MADYVSTKDFMQEMKELREEAKKDRHTFGNNIQWNFEKFDAKLEKVIDNYVKIEIMERDVKIIKDDHKEIRITVDNISKKMWTWMWFIWAVSGIGTFVAQIYFK